MKEAIRTVRQRHEKNGIIMVGRSEKPMGHSEMTMEDMIILVNRPRSVSRMSRYVLLLPIIPPRFLFLHARRR